jgi:hypothetical protein
VKKEIKVTSYKLQVTGSVEAYQPATEKKVSKEFRGCKLSNHENNKNNKKMAGKTGVDKLADRFINFNSPLLFPPARKERLPFRVTRLGEFSRFGRLFFGNFFENYKRSPSFEATF